MEEELINIVQLWMKPKMENIVDSAQTKGMRTFSAHLFTRDKNIIIRARYCNKVFGVLCIKSPLSL